MEIKKHRYAIPAEEDFEPDSKDEVLRNYLGVKSKEEMELLEAQELKRAELALLETQVNHQFTAEDICTIHELWLGDIYPFAGKYRTVNLTKDGFLFAASQRIADLMVKFEKDFLTQYTPCNDFDMEQLARALGIVHIELILIHPFREGNGRAARLLADLMVMQAKRPSLDYSPIDQTKNEKGFNEYIAAIHSGVDGDYEPIQKLFKKMLELPIS